MEDEGIKLNMKLNMEIEEYLKIISTEQMALTNRLNKTLEEIKQEKDYLIKLNKEAKEENKNQLEIILEITKVLSKEVKEIKEHNLEKIGETFKEVAKTKEENRNHHIETIMCLKEISTLSWKDRVKQYGIQLSITSFIILFLGLLIYFVYNFGK